MKNLFYEDFSDATMKTKDVKQGDVPGASIIQ